MCELMGLTFNRPVSPSFSFRGFRHRSAANPHGWGIGYYPAGKGCAARAAQVIKEPVKADGSSMSAFLFQRYPVRSSVIIAHVRKASVGAKTHANTHPYQRELGGRDFIFTHNGTLRGYRGLDPGRRAPLGTTDSEYVFCHLLDFVEKKKLAAWRKRDLVWLEAKCREINGFGTFNAIFSDGRLCFCYVDRKRYNGGLSAVRRAPPFRRIKLSDEDWEVRFDKKSGERGYVIATRPLTEREAWRPLDEARLHVFRKGEKIC